MESIMQLDFHYYATYCAAYLAGYSHEESMEICYSAQFVDCCTATYLGKIGAPLSAATTQSQGELMNVKPDRASLQDVTRIWSSFHFLPYDLYADPGRGSRIYKNKYRLICNPNGNLVIDTVRLAVDQPLQAVGLAMHVLADTWAHRYFAGTPSLVINNTNQYFWELLPSATIETTSSTIETASSTIERTSSSIKTEGSSSVEEASSSIPQEDSPSYIERPIQFRHSLNTPDDLEQSIYVNSVYHSSENSIMNLGHGRAGHLPDYSCVSYRYLPAWGDYAEITKENPKDYYAAFCQMVEAMRYLRGEIDTFDKEEYNCQQVEPWKEEIQRILSIRQSDASADWKALAEKLSGREMDTFDQTAYMQEYMDAPEEEKDDTYLGRFILAAMRQKSMVTNRIFISGNLLAGYSVDYQQGGFQGVRDFMKLVEYQHKNKGRHSRKNRE